MARTSDTSIRLRNAGTGSARIPHFRALVEQAAHAIAILHHQGNLRYANGTLRRWLNLDPARFNSQTFAAFLNPNDARHLARVLDSLQPAGSPPAPLEPFQLVSPDHTVRYLEGTATRLPSRSGPDHRVLHLHDITARREAEHRTRRSEEGARILHSLASSLLELDSEEDVVWDVARNCVGRLGLPDCVVYLTDPAHRILVQRAAWGTKAPSGRQILHPISIPIGHGVVGTAAANGRPEMVPDTRLDSRYIVDDSFRLSELAVPFFVGGEVAGVIDLEHPEPNFFDAHHLDLVSAIAALLANKLVRVRSEQALRSLNIELEQRVAERTAQLQATNDRLQREVAERARAQRIQQALYQISEAIHQAGDLQDLYQRIHEIIGTLMPARNFYIALQDQVSGVVSFPYHVDEVDPPPPPRRGHPGFTEYVLRTGRTCLANLTEIKRLRQAGEYIPTGVPALIWLGAPLLVRDQPIGVMAVQDHHNPDAFNEEDKQILSFVADQTALAIDRKRAGQELHRALEQERELVRLKTNFANLVSHEFRTPIGVIVSSAQVLDSYFDRLTPPRRHEHLGDIVEAARHMAGLIDEVLLLGRIEAGRLAFQSRPLDLPSFCRRLADEVQQASGLRCPIDVIAPDTLPPAHSDETLLRHILGNLLTNAVKYSPAHTPVSLSISAIANNAILTVRDQGIGIPAEDQPRLFEVFCRGRNVGELPGTGLGLVIVKRCVEVHRGAVSLTSQAGRGTTVVVQLPVFPTPTSIPSPILP